MLTPYLGYHQKIYKNFPSPKFFKKKPAINNIYTFNKHKGKRGGATRAGGAT